MQASRQISKRLSPFALSSLVPAVASGLLLLVGVAIGRWLGSSSLSYSTYMAGAVGLIALPALIVGVLAATDARRRETEARGQAILRAAPDLMFLLTRDGTYVDFYAPSEGQLLYPPSEFIGRHMRDVLPPALAALFEERFAHLAYSDGPEVVEHSLRVDGEERSYEARLVPCGALHVLAIVRDISERKRAETALQESQERYQLATTAARVAVWDWNVDTNDLYVDASLKTLLGYGNDLHDRLDDWINVTHPDDARQALKLAEEHLRDRTPFYEIEVRMSHRDGSLRWLLVRGSAYHDGRTPRRIIGTVTDITDRKTAEQALHDAHAELNRVSRLTALGEFAASIAHEVRQPLTAIRLNARTCLKWLDNGYGSPDRLRPVLEELVESSRVASEVIHRNRELFRHRTVQKAPLDINSVVREVLALARSRLETSHVRVVVFLSAHLPLVEGDRVELQQVLLNLISNSIDAMDAVEQQLRVLNVASREAGDSVQVSVKDNGVGLDGVDLERMFTSSYTTKANGTGIGLSLSRAIVEAHGGRLWAEQNTDRGATFSFSVPAASSAAVA